MRAWWSAVLDGLDDAADMVLRALLVAGCVGALAAIVHSLVTLARIGAPE